MNNASGKTSPEAREEAAGATALYDYFARLFLDPIEVPGTSYLVDLHERTSCLFAGVAPEDDEAMRAMATWIVRVNALRECAAGERGARDEVGAQAETGAQAEQDTQAALEEEQRLLATDRTLLCRGVQAAGPLPPYEEYYAGGLGEGEAAAATLGSAAAAYRQAGVHFDEQRKERDDYAGTELAFLACLAQREAAALDQEDSTAADEAHAARAAFEHAHLPWLRSYAATARPHARTAFWQGALGILESIAE